MNIRFRQCVLEYDENNRVILTLLVGDERGPSMMLPENQDNPMYEPVRETPYSLALQQQADEIITAIPHDEMG